MKKTYILFLYGTFEDFDDVQFFCLDVIGESKKVEEIKYIIQDLRNIIVILDSTADKNELEEELSTLLNNENIDFYFAFEKSALFMVHLPENMKDVIFKPKHFSEQSKLTVDLDLDTILDKIKNQGLDSLTSEEKNFLDNFKL